MITVKNVWSSVRWERRNLLAALVPPVCLICRAPDAARCPICAMPYCAYHSDHLHSRRFYQGIAI